MSPFALAAAIIGIALTFDFINGFHDAANSVATVVATRVLTPLQAVGWAAFFNFLAAYIFYKVKVATTVTGQPVATKTCPAVAWSSSAYSPALPTSTPPPGEPTTFTVAPGSAPARRSAAMSTASFCTGSPMRTTVTRVELSRPRRSSVVSPERSDSETSWSSSSRPGIGLP